MKTRTTAALISCALVCALASAVRGQQNPSFPPPKAGFSFPQKQTLTYSVDWRVFPAGTAVVHFEAAGDAERVSATAMLHKYKMRYFPFRQHEMGSL